MQEIKPTDIQAYLQYLQREKGLASNTALKHYNFLNAVFNLLEQQEVINRNPVKRVIAPKKAKHEAEYLTADEATAILEHSKGDRMELPFTLGLYTGMRRGEALGLKWSAINLVDMTFTVRHTITLVGAKEVAADRTKSTSSLRTLDLTESVKDYLQKLLEYQTAMKAICGNSYDDNDYVCKWPDDRR